MQVINCVGGIANGAEDGAAGQFGSVLQLDERRVADRFDDVVVNGHVYKIAGSLPNR